MHILKLSVICVFSVITKQMDHDTICLLYHELPQYSQYDIYAPLFPQISTKETDHFVAEICPSSPAVSLSVQGALKMIWRQEAETEVCCSNCSSIEQSGQVSSHLLEFSPQL